MSETKDELLTASEVADVLRISTNTVTKMARKGQLPSYRIGGQYRFKVSQLEEWLKGNKAHRNWIESDAPVFPRASERAPLPVRNLRQCVCGNTLGKSERRCATCRQDNLLKTRAYQRDYYQHVLKDRRRAAKGK